MAQTHMIDNNIKDSNITDNIVRTKKGLVQGVREGDCLVFKNIPYAKPPAGELRFKRPVETDSWDGVLDCTKFGNITPQNLPGDEMPWEKLYHKEFYSDEAYLRNMDEDCLNLNIWIPAETNRHRLPVAFWIHGGGFAGGYSSEIEFGGESFVKNGIILVTVEYRCGVLGFMAHPWLSAEDELGISGNYGIFDQIAALNWVYDNISAFGGDPDNITVFGQSAGCMSTQVLISSELTENKIAGAILQSGVQVNTHYMASPTLKEAEQYGERIVQLAGISSLQELRVAPVHQLIQAKDMFDAETREYMMQHPEIEADALRIVPNVDGFLLKKNIRDVFRDAEIKNIPYIVGCTADDLGTTDKDRRNNTPGWIMEESRAFCSGVNKMFGRNAYCYLFARELPGENGSSDLAFHSAELWYTFGTLERCWRPMTEHDRQLSREMSLDWAQFMKTGNPGNGWKPCSENESAVKIYR